MYFLGTTFIFSAFLAMSYYDYRLQKKKEEEEKKDTELVK